MEIIGKLHKKYDTKEVSSKFQKREFVVEYAENPMYPQYPIFQLVQDAVTKIDGFKEGDMIRVEFDIKGREWTSPQGEVKYFNTLQAWRLHTADSSLQEKAKEPELVEVLDVTQQEDDDDLPF